MDAATRPAGRPHVPNYPALVHASRAVVDSRLVRPTTGAAAAPVGVDLLQDLRGDLRDRHVAEGRLDRASDVAAVAVERRRLRLVRPQPGLHRHAECGLGLRAPLFVDLGEEPGEDLLRLDLIARPLDEEWSLPVSGSTPA
jgi:hypothetical protein